MATAKTPQSIRRNIRRALLLFAAITVAFLWFSQIVLLKPYYRMMQTVNVRRAGDELMQHVGDEDFAERLEKTCAGANMSAILLGSDGVELVSLNMLGNKNMLAGRGLSAVMRLCSPVLEGEQTSMTATVGGKQEIRELSGGTPDTAAQESRPQPPQENETPPEKPAGEGLSGELTHTAPEFPAELNGMAFREEAVVYAARVEAEDGTPRILILNAMLAPVESTVSILKSQLLITSAVLVLLSLVLSGVLSKRLVRPLRRITDQAKRLAQGDYTADYAGDGIAEIEELADTLNFSAEGLSRVEGLRRELVANVSHDLKTPLTMIIGYAEMIRDLTGDDKEKRDEQLGVIVDEAQRLTGLVNDLIRVSRDEAAADELHSEPIDLSAMISELIGRFSATCPDYTFETDLCNGKALADRTATGQVLYNLISNAINYTGEDRRVAVSAKPCETGVRVEIRDTGAGIPADQLPLIWERYYRSRNTHQRPVAGSGLGLSIVRSALERQGFPYGVESEVGKGSCFWFEAPLAGNNDN